MEETTTIFCGADEETVDKWVKAMKPVGIDKTAKNMFQGQMNAARAVVSGNRKRYQVRRRIARAPWPRLEAVCGLLPPASTVFCFSAARAVCRCFFFFCFLGCCSAG